MKPKKKRSRLTNAALCADLPLKLLPGVPYFEIQSDQSLWMEGQRGILELGEELVRIDCRMFSVAVRGQDLCIRSMEAQSLSLTGQIDSITFEHTGEA